MLLLLFGNTDALVRRGIAQERLILIEYNPDFCELLARRFPRATVVQGDAYAIRETAGPLLSAKGAATISSLPLFTKPPEQRLALLNAAHDLMQASAPFIQFTYALVPPIPERCDAGSYMASRSNKVWLNLPPARVWVYRRP